MEIKTGSSNNWRLFNTSCIENKDELEEKFERCHGVLQGLTAGLSEKEAHDTLNNAVCKDKTHEEVSLGLLVVILTDPQDATKSYRDLTLITRDGLAIVLSHLNQLVLERYLRLNDTTRSQLLWLLRELIRTNIAGVDNLCLSLLRHAAGGDISPRNIYLVEALLDIFQDNRPWVGNFPYLVAFIVYTYLRLIEDHSAPHLQQLRAKEVTFTVTLIREHIVDCLLIGRDLVRLLQNVARLPEFESLWRDLLTNPRSLNPNLTGVLQLLQTRTSRRFLQSRLTPDMERKLVFLTASVRFGNHKRYQDWFQRQYLATPESQSLRCDLIRFIVGVIHPTNELLCSDIIPRWAVIGWLLTTCTSNVAASNAKLALFYDWLFFDPEKDNIMNIEPAILVMNNSMRSHPATMERIVQMILEDDLGVDSITPLANCLSTILASEITSDIFPSNNLNDEALTDSISTPIFVMFRNYFQLCKEEDSRKKFLGHMLAELQNLQPSIGYLLLYFLKVWGREEEKREGLASNITNEVKAAVYKDFSHHRNKKLEACLLDDLKNCHQDNVLLLCYLVPDVFMGFQNIALGNATLLHLVVSTVDSCQLQDLVCQILQGQLKMLEKDSFNGLLMKSLEWETFEQYCFWQLITAHDFPIKYVLPVVPKLQFKNHAEAMTAILPTLELLRQLFTRQNNDGDTFVVAALRYWCRDYEDKLGELLANLLSTRYPATSPNKRKRAGAKQNQQQSGPPTGEQVLGHLDQLRQHCRASSDLQLYQTEGMQKALQQAQAASSDSLRKSYGDLFALAEVNEENEPPPPPPTSSSRKHTASATGSSKTGAGHRKIISTRERTASKRPPPRDHFS
ncbi:Similar to Ints3: Integrator complex subunit 3 (Mus musculus) [Cotesia congregata]|uniref:SOSS complex subunit A homolog n=1 Tax=Cotesia congregata TaxID=51543 RepID=A0A8J2H968_COTCN|nr:Similar to Ints3: Integrator complex subunit 3 (Mus musculus) [Cotesia congregata]